MLRDESQMTCFPVYHLLVGCNTLKEWWKKIHFKATWQKPTIEGEKKTELAQNKNIHQ